MERRERRLAHDPRPRREKRRRRCRDTEALSTGIVFRAGRGGGCLSRMSFFDPLLLLLPLVRERPPRPSMAEAASGLSKHVVSSRTAKGGRTAQERALCTVQFVFPFPLLQ